MRLEIVHRDISDIYIYETRRLLGVQKEDIVRSIELKIGWRIYKEFLLESSSWIQEFFRTI